MYLMEEWEEKKNQSRRRYAKQRPQSRSPHNLVALLLQRLHVLFPYLKIVRFVCLSVKTYAMDDCSASICSLKIPWLRVAARVRYVGTRLKRFYFSVDAVSPPLSSASLAYCCCSSLLSRVCGAAAFRGCARGGSAAPCTLAQLSLASALRSHHHRTKLPHKNRKS